MDLIAFITARLDEDEAAARAALSGSADGGVWEIAYPYGGNAAMIRGQGIAMMQEKPQAGHIARHDPARALREVALGRVILAQHGRSPHWRPGDELLDCQYQKWPCPTLRALAAIWSDHPDYCTG